MTDYLMMIQERDPCAAAELAERLDAEAAFARRLDALGALIDSGRLHPSRDRKLVTRRDDGVVVDDGPFDRGMASYYLVHAGDLDAAVALAHDYPLARADILDIRPVVKGNVPPGKLDQPGKVFAFSVMARAPDEPTWSELMERIDDDTKDKFPKEGMLGGMRLDVPRTGRRIAFDKGKRGLIDGPFLEAKEVIGGLFFRRLPSIDDAVRWATTTGFVVHGSLEIAELWRS